MSIRAHELTKVYRLGGEEIRALDGLDFHAGRGEFVGVVGASGSGKTTLLNLLAGLDRPSSGTIDTPWGRLSGLDPTGLARYRRDRVGMVFQAFHLVPHLTALQNVETALLFTNAPRRVRAERAREALAKLGLANRARHRPRDLSGGEQQRVALARALVKDPSLLLADEPTGNLDRDNALQIADILSACSADGVTVVLVTHDLALAERCAHRTIRLGYGRVADDGDAS